MGRLNELIWQISCNKLYIFCPFLQQKSLFIEQINSSQREVHLGFVESCIQWDLDGAVASCWSVFGEGSTIWFLFDQSNGHMEPCRGLALVCLAACEQGWIVTHIMGSLQISHISASYDFLREYFSLLRKGFLWETYFFLGNAVSQSCHCKLHPSRAVQTCILCSSICMMSKKRGKGDNLLLSSPPFIFSSSRKFYKLLHWYFFLLMFTLISPATVTIVSVLIPSLTWNFTLKRL